MKTSRIFIIVGCVFIGISVWNTNRNIHNNSQKELIDQILLTQKSEFKYIQNLQEGLMTTFESIQIDRQRLSLLEAKQ